jgi:hypothetical protein
VQSVNAFEMLMNISHCYPICHYELRKHCDVLHDHTVLETDYTLAIWQTLIQGMKAKN